MRLRGDRGRDVCGLLPPCVIPDNSDLFSQVFNQAGRLLGNSGQEKEKGPTGVTPADPFFRKREA